TTGGRSVLSLTACLAACARSAASMRSLPAGTTVLACVWTERPSLFSEVAGRFRAPGQTSVDGHRGVAGRGGSDGEEALSFARRSRRMEAGSTIDGKAAAVSCT